MSEILHLSNIIRTYRSESESLSVLKGVELSLRCGEIVALVAPSGSGKSTLLHLAGLLEKPDGGAVFINGVDAGRLPDQDRTNIRLRTIGIVYQFHHLLAEFTALENVAMPQMIAGKSPAEAAARAGDLLGRLGLASRAGHLPGKLSGGEQQRVAIARALANQPALLLADEPTGNLDSHTGLEIIELLKQLRAEKQMTLVIATHDAKVAATAPRVIELVDGRISA